MKKFYVLIMLLVCATECFACICWFPTDKKALKKRIKEADVILYVLAIPADSLNRDFQRGDYLGIEEIIFKVEHIWKGDRRATMRFKGKKSPCKDAVYRIGERYIIFGYTNNETGELEANNCTGLSEHTMPSVRDKIEMESEDFNYESYREARLKEKEEFESVKRLISKQTRR